MDAGAEPQPLAQGNLLETPLCHLALYVYRHSQTGTLQIADAAGLAAQLRVQRGRITGARLPWPGERLLDALLPLCALREAQFAFFGADFFEGDASALSGVVDPYELLIASLDDHARDDMVDAVLRRFAGKRLRLAPGRDLERLRLRPAHKPLIELIRAAPATADELVRDTPMPHERTRRLLYALIAMNMITPHETRDDEIFKSQVEPRSLQPGPQNAQRTENSQAWQRLASLRPMGSLRPAGNSLAPATAAPKESKPATSTSQVSLRPATSTPPAPEDKAVRQRRAEQLLQRARHDEALAEIDGLLEGEPDSADFLALRAQALFEKHQVQADGLPRSAVDAIKKALEVDPEHPRALYTKGMMFKRSGEPKKALLCFKRVVQIDPKHLEAGREIRLAKLRGDSQS